MRFLIFLLTLSMSVTTFFGQDTLSGRITDYHSHEPLPGATIFIPDLKTGTATDKDGKYQLTNLPNSMLLIQVSFVGYRALIEKVNPEKTPVKDFQLSESFIEAQEVVITGNALSSDNNKTSISVTPINKAQLFTIPSTNIIDAIATVPGVSQITTGGEISKPVIRGLGYNHVVTLNDGVRMEGGQWGDEHGVEIDQFSIDRIEVLKGPASLFHGSDAMGGVINILEPIPAPMGSICGELASQFSINNRLYSNSLMLEGNHNGNLWRLRGTWKDAGSYKTPTEYIYNSGFDEKNLTALLGMNKKWGFTHLHLSLFNTRIGMQEGARDSVSGHFLDPEGNVVTEEGARSRAIGVPFQRVAHYKISSTSNFIFHNNQLKVNVGYQQNDRREYAETLDHPGLFFRLNTFTGDVRWAHVIKESLELVAGASGMIQTNRNLGTEFLIPDYDLQEAGGFLYGKKTWEYFSLNLGMRGDYRHETGKPLFLDSLEHPSSKGEVKFTAFNSNFSAFTGSVGFTWNPTRILNFKLNIGRGFRAPNIAELGSNGVHEGTFRYEIGNPDLSPETSLQFDGEFAFKAEYLQFIVNGFYNFINYFIYAQNVNHEMKLYHGINYPVYRYTQGNSVLRGFEIELDIHPIDQLHFDNNIDYVQGTN
ncbi:MAG: TonB-dependent receptor, partial [Bacteroidota bacterium]